jgi:hypothetical protein
MKKLTLIICFSAILISCATFERSANKHLKLAEQHLAKAKMKGAIIHSDTVYVDVVTSGSITDTVYVSTDVDRIFHDTITIETAKWKTRTRIDTVTKKIYQQVECKPDTVKVPVSVVTEIKSDKSKDWQKYALGALTGIVLLLIAFAFRR